MGIISEGLAGNRHQFRFALSFAYSDWAEARDRDDHVLRYKLSEADCQGQAYLINVDLEWNFLPQWVLGLDAEYMDIETTGKQHQRFYAGTYVGTTYEVDDRITSSYWSGIVKILYEF